MAQLLVRNLDPLLVRDLKKRAGEHGVSVEEEHRRILREALGRKKKSLWEMIGEMPEGEDDDLFLRDRTSGGRATDQHILES